MSTAEEFKGQGNKALQAKDYDGAIAAYTKAIELDNTQHVYFSNRSAAYLSKGDAQGALSDAEQCVNISPTWAKGYSRKGAALHALKRYQEAINAYEDGLKVAPDDAALRNGLEDVRKAQDAGKRSAGGMGQNPFAALFGPESLVKLAGHPKFGKYLSDPAFMAKMQMMQTNPQMGTALLQDPQIQEVFSFLMGIDFRTAGSAPGAGDEDDMDSSGPTVQPSTKQPEETAPMEQEPDLSAEKKEQKKRKVEALEAKERGNKLYAKKEFDDALAAYEEAHSIDPTNMTFLTNKAAVYFEKGEHDQAIKQCEEAIELGRQNRADYADVAKAYVRMGKAYLKKDDVGSALKSFRQAQVENFSKDVERLIKNTELESRKKEAMAYRDPEKAAEAKERGNELFRGGDFVGAIREYEDAIKRDPENAAYRNNLAAALAKVGDFPGARDACAKAIELDAKYVKAWAKKGDVEFFMKEYHKALESYKRGLEIEPDNSLCKQGLAKTTMKIRQESSSKEVDTERAAHALADPDIQNILSDPIIRQVLNDLQDGSAAGQQALRDPSVAAKIEKLIAAGVLRTG